MGNGDTWGIGETVQKPAATRIPTSIAVSANTGLGQALTVKTASRALVRYMQVPPGRVRRHGFISGSVSCQDIDYMADDDEKIVDSQHLTKIKENGPDFSPCPIVEEGSVEHDCPAQVVPGFRFEFNIMHYSILLA